MVKVQKPIPKNLTNVGNKENVRKEKKKSVKIAKAAKPSVEMKKSMKEIVIVKSVKEAQNLVKPRNADRLAEKAERKPKQNASKKKKEEQENATPKRPLVLAPPESPKPVAVKTKVTKEKPKKELAAPVEIVKIKKKTKKAKATTIVAPKPENAEQPPLTKLQKKKAIKRAFKKQQLKKRRAGKEKKPKAAPQQHFEPMPFDEDKFNAIVNVSNITNIAKGLKKLVEKEVAEKKTAIFSDYRYSLNVTYFKIPNCPKRMVKLNLKHSLVDKDDDVVIIVPDLQRGSKVDYDPTIQHYEDLFREAGVDGLKIMPFNQLRTECNTFEAMRKFSNTYDYFLCDGRLVGRVGGFCGKIFQKPRTTIHSVRLETGNLKAEIEKSLRRTAYKQLHKGDLISIPVGNHKYNMKQLAENVLHVVEQLDKILPGGLGNVRSMMLKIDLVGTSSLPFYISASQPPADTPYTVGPREQRMLKLKKDANMVLSKFTMTKDAEIIKLDRSQVERKRKLKEAHATLLAEKSGKPAKSDDDEDDGVTAKKAKKEKQSKVEKVVKDVKKKKRENKTAKIDEKDADNDSDNVNNYCMPVNDGKVEKVGKDKKKRKAEIKTAKIDEKDTDNDSDNVDNDDEDEDINADIDFDSNDDSE